MPKFYGLAVTYQSTATLKPYKNNPRIHSPKQIKQIARSIEEFGFTNPILLDDDNNIIAGHGRILAAQSLSIDQVPTIKIGNMSEAQKRAYIIADNKLALNAGWDENLLKIELDAILTMDTDFDLTITGFETGELDFRLIDAQVSEEPSVPDLPIVPTSQLGDLWMLGAHKVFCGDATNTDSYEILLGGRQAAMVFTDPPYNVPIAGHVSGKGAVQHDEFVMASGEMTSAEFTAFLSKTIDLLQKNSRDGSLHYLCMDWRHIHELLKACSSYTEQKNLCVWNKTTGGMGSLYRSQHELIFVFKHGKKPHLNNIELGKHGRNRTNVWDYPGVNNFNNREKNSELAMHPTVKPVKMIAEVIQDCTKRGELILDCFGGSGSTLIAVHDTGRKSALIEMDPKYVDVIIKRYQQHTGLEVIHSDNGKTYEDLTNERSLNSKVAS